MKKISLFLWGAAVLVFFAIQSCNKESAKTAAGDSQQQNATTAMISENGANPDETMLTAGSSGSVEMTAENSAGNSRHNGGALFIF